MFSAMRARLLLAVLLAAALTQAQKAPQPRLLSVEGIKQAASKLWKGSTGQGLTCTTCVQLAMQIGSQLYKPPDVDSEDPNIAVAGPGRHMRVKYKEPEIMAALDTACSKLAASQQLSQAVQQDCERLVKEHRSVLESFIFDEGTDGLAASMCVEQLGLCSWHDMMDSGEL